MSWSAADLVVRMFGCEKSQPRPGERRLQLDADPFDKHLNLHFLHTLCQFHIEKKGSASETIKMVLPRQLNRFTTRPTTVEGYMIYKYEQCMDPIMADVQTLFLFLFCSVAILKSHIDNHTDYHVDCHKVILSDLCNLLLSRCHIYQKILRCTETTFWLTIW